MNENGHGVILPLLTLEETEQILKVSRGTIYRLMRSGELPVVRIGGRTLVERPVLRDFIAARRA